MVGTDLSQTASRAVGWANDFAERFGAELHLVQVIIPGNPSDTEFGGLYGLGVEFIPDGSGGLFVKHVSGNYRFARK